MDKGVRWFLKIISLKVNIIAGLGIELAYYNEVVQYVSHYFYPISRPYMNVRLNHL